jgi:1-acyl-sn-glycerol-3-phosphate acyltransferase
MWIIRKIMGIEFDVRGRENLPTNGPFIIASKHQSAWDTLIYNIIVLDCAYVVKRELFSFPFFGWFLWRVGMIGIDRKGGASTLKQLVANCKARLAEGRSIIIFPQGTRTAPGTQNPYLPGIAALYAQCNVPVVPTALNSGMFWPRRTFLKYPGTIVIEFLPAIEPGLKRREFSARLEAAIEPATTRIEEEARRVFNVGDQIAD